MSHNNTSASYGSTTANRTHRPDQMGSGAESSGVRVLKHRERQTTPATDGFWTLGNLWIADRVYERPPDIAQQPASSAEVVATASRSGQRGRLIPRGTTYYRSEAQNRTLPCDRIPPAGWISTGQVTERDYWVEAPSGFSSVVIPAETRYLPDLIGERLRGQTASEPRHLSSPSGSTPQSVPPRVRSGASTSASSSQRVPVFIPAGTKCYHSKEYGLLPFIEEPKGPGWQPADRTTDEDCWVVLPDE